MELLLLTVYLLLQVGDYWTTHKVLSQGGTEANPVVRELMDIFGVPVGLALVKLVGVLAGIVLWTYDQSHWLAILSAGYGYVVYKNYGQIK